MGSKIAILRKKRNSISFADQISPEEGEILLSYFMEYKAIIGRLGFVQILKKLGGIESIRQIKARSDFDKTIALLRDAAGAVREEAIKDIQAKHNLLLKAVAKLDAKKAQELKKVRSKSTKKKRGIV